MTTVRSKTPRRKVPRHRAGTPSVYADLGYKNAGEMAIKAQLVTRIAEILAERHVTQTEAGHLLGIPQPKLSKILRGQFRGVSERKLIDCLTLLGQDVNILVRKSAAPRRRGHISVAFG